MKAPRADNPHLSQPGEGFPERFDLASTRGPYRVSRVCPHPRERVAVVTIEEPNHYPTFVVCDLDTGRVEAAVPCRAAALHPATGNLFTLTNNLLVESTWPDGRVVGPERWIYNHADHFIGLLVASSGEWAAGLSEGPYFRGYELVSLVTGLSTQGICGHLDAEYSVVGAAFSPDSTKLATVLGSGGDDGVSFKLAIHDLEAGALRTMPVPRVTCRQCGGYPIYTQRSDPTWISGTSLKVPGVRKLIDIKDTTSMTVYPRARVPKLRPPWDKLYGPNR